MNHPRMASRARLTAEASVVASAAELYGAVAKNIWHFEHYRRRPKSGTLYLLDQWSTKNLIVNEGLDYLHDVALLAATPITSWYIGLTDGTPTIAAADVMNSHAGWTEVVDYDEATRELWNGTGTGVGTGDNDASKAEFTINANVTVGGAFMTSGSGKSGTTGTLYGAVAFSGGDRALLDTDILRIRANTSVANA